MHILIHTFLMRPYVFAFLAAFLFLSIKHQGLIKTIIWLVAGYFIAFLSEYSSIHNGFPYGEYHYIYDNLKGELILAGVPVWDSISYSFMTYASYSALVYAKPKWNMWKIILGSAFLTTLLDIITDPVAKLGKKWFLGEIYYYAHDGWYFNVPFSNFAGWFLVALLIIGISILIFKLFNLKDRTHPCILNPIFYISICLFNTVIAFMINAYSLGTVNLIITTALILFLVKHVK